VLQGCCYCIILSVHGTQYADPSQQGVFRHHKLCGNRPVYKLNMTLIHTTTLFTSTQKAGSPYWQLMACWLKSENHHMLPHFQSLASVYTAIYQIWHSRGVSPKQQTYISTNKHSSHEDGGISDKQNNASLWPNWLPQVKGPLKQENTEREFSRCWVSCNGCPDLSFSLKQTFTMTDSHTLCPAIDCQETQTQCLQAQVLKWFSFGNNIQLHSHF
jgi:hypothetical protein